ncbi:MAG: phosphoadenylyl-sulfate reductase [Myxococcota bacterium]
MDVLADENVEAEDLLARAYARFGERTLFTNAIDLEGSVIAHMIAKAGLPIRMVTLDTDVLFPDTYETRQRLQDVLGVEIEAIRPALTLEEQAEQIGPQLWQTQPNRCCQIRKVEPLERVLSEAQGWITGIRRDQTPERAHAPKVSEDARFGVTKFNPLADWSIDRVRAYLAEHNVPYNPMFDAGYPSIGCAPCTRAVQAGEDPRAGRWSGFEKRECGLHFETKADGTVSLKRSAQS